MKQDIKSIRIVYAVRDLATDLTGDYKAYDKILEDHLQEFYDACEKGMKENYAEILNFTLYAGTTENYKLDVFINEIVAEAVCEVLTKYTELGE